MGEGVQSPVWGYQALPATPHQCGDPLGVSTLTNKSHRSALPEGTPVGQKKQLKTPILDQRLSCSLLLWGGRIYQPENFLNITAVVSELLFLKPKKAVHSPL